MNEHYFKETKGQSAIEYLMTYGWMLLVVAIVGGAIFATVQGQCAQSASGFTGGDVQVENFGINSEGDLQMELRNGGSDQVTVNDAEVTDGENTANITAEDEETPISVGSTSTISVGAGEFTDSDGCNDFDISFNYDAGELDDQETSGTLTDSIEFSS